MNTNLCNALKRIVTEKGEAVLDDTKQLNSLLSQYAANEPQPEKKALITFLMNGCHKTLKQSSDSDRLNCKISLAQRLRDEEGIDIHLCKNAIDVMESVFFGKVTTRPQAVNPAPSAPQPVYQPPAPRPSPQAPPPMPDPPSTPAPSNVLPSVPANRPAKRRKPKAVIIAAAAVVAVLFIVLLINTLPRETPDELFQKGNTFFDSGDYKKAIDYYSRAIKGKPFADVYYNRGLAYQRLENYSQSITDFTQAIAYNKEYYDAYYYRGVDYGNMQNYDAAIGDLNYYANINPGYKVTFYLLGFAYMNTGKYDSAITACTSAVAIDPNYIEAYNLRGALYLSAERYNAAIQDFSRVLEIDPSNYDAINYLAAAKEAKDAGDQAMVEELLSTLMSGGDLFTFGYQLGFGALLWD